MYQRIDLSGPTAVGVPGGLPVELRGLALSTLEDLSQEYNISRERVRQIEVRAFEKLQKAMKNLTIEQQVAANEIATS